MLYNKYKPKTFGEMLGNKEIFTTLQNYIDIDMPHCILLYGEHGCGKSSSADILANSIPDVYVEVIDASRDNGVEVSREIARNASSIPLGYKNKVYILEEIHSVSDKFYDALLLVTNDPPPNTFFIIVTTELNKVRATIKSRFIKFNFKPPPLQEMRDHLSYLCDEEKIKTNRKVLTKICNKNSMIPRDCLSDLSLIMGVDSPEEQLTLLGKSTNNTSSGYDIAVALDKGVPWAVVRKMLVDVTDNDVEGIRRTVLSYHRKVFLGGKDSRAALLVEFFRAIS
jgi:DNA polymerase-3 subunit gamma/tau